MLFGLHNTETTVLSNLASSFFIDTYLGSFSLVKINTCHGVQSYLHHNFQVFLGHSGGLDTEGNELPRLVYVSREKRPGFQHHKKAGAMNALVSFQNYQ